LGITNGTGSRNNPSAVVVIKFHRFRDTQIIISASRSVLWRIIKKQRLHRSNPLPIKSKMTDGAQMRNG